MNWNQIQSAINDGLLIGGSVILTLVAAFLVSKRWPPVRITGLILLIIATQGAPTRVVWWSALVLTAITVAAAVFIARGIAQPSTEQIIAAVKPSPIGDIAAGLQTARESIRSRSPRIMLSAIRSLVATLGIRRAHAVIAGLLASGLIIAGTFHLSVLALLALVLSAVLVGGAFYMKRALTAGAASTEEAPETKGAAVAEVPVEPLVEAPVSPALEA